MAADESLHAQAEAAMDWVPAASRENLAFKVVSHRTHCLFASRSVSWAAPAIEDPCSPGELELLARRLRGFTRAARTDRLDCFVATFPSAFGRDVQSLAVLTNTVLRGLKLRDGLWPFLGNPGRPGWKYTFDGHPYFVLAMGACYPRAHARHTFGAPVTMLVFQPDVAFERVVSLSGDGLISASVRGAIRAAYTSAGMRYDLRHTEGPVDAHRFVKPLLNGEPFVPWWTMPTLSGRHRRAAPSIHDVGSRKR